jgi:hypothetical protein
MKATNYIAMNAIRKQLKELRTEVIGARVAVTICILLGVWSFMAMEWEALVASVMVMSAPMATLHLIRKRSEVLEERIFQFRLKHGFKTIS